MGVIMSGGRGGMISRGKKGDNDDTKGDKNNCDDTKGNEYTTINQYVRNNDAARSE